MGFWNTLGNIAKIAAPVVGAAVGGPAGLAIGSAVSSGIGGLQADRKKGKLNNDALQLAMERWKAMEPFRQQALTIGQNLQPSRPDLSSVFANGNPFARQQPDLSGLMLPKAPPPASVPSAPEMSRPRGGRRMPPGMGGPHVMDRPGMEHMMLQRALQGRGEMMT